MTQALKQQIYTPEEYLELEVASETRNEYRNGAIISMTGGTPDHNDIASNLVVALKLALRSKPYDDPNVTLSFSVFEFQIQIADLYENIEFLASNS